jgi:hypothetical protein
MILAWPMRRQEALRARHALLISVVATVACVAALSGPFLGMHRAVQDAARVAAPERVAVTFVTPPRPKPIRPDPLAPALPRPRGVDVPAAAESGTVGAVATPPTDSSLRGDTARTPETLRQPSRVADRPRLVLGPTLAASAFYSRSAAAKPNEAMGRMTTTTARLSSEEERNATMTEAEKRSAEARANNPPADVYARTGMINIPLPLFSMGPSRKQRARDSAIHQDNVQRLGRLIERAEAKRESIRVADSARRARPDWP